MNKRQIICEYLKANGVSKKEKIYDAINAQSWYYCNATKHFGEILSRMVNAGILEREKIGYYCLKDGVVFEGSKCVSNDPNQLDMVL